MSFELFDPEGDLQISQRHLPHWYQPGVTYFVTFRTVDSLPKEVVALWLRQRKDWLLRQRIDSEDANWEADLAQLPELVQREFHRKFSRELLEYLDQGYGACVLRRRELAQIVATSLRHFDGERCLLGDFVIMPNHVHLLVCLLGCTEIKSLCYSWKKFTALQINRALDQTGGFWQSESFDHLVRNPDQFGRLQRYIAENGKKAGLSEGEYLHWRRQE